MYQTHWFLNIISHSIQAVSQPRGQVSLRFTNSHLKIYFQTGTNSATLLGENLIIFDKINGCDTNKTCNNSLESSSRYWLLIEYRFEFLQFSYNFHKPVVRGIGSFQFRLILIELCNYSQYGREPFGFDQWCSAESQAYTNFVVQVLMLLRRNT